MLDRATVAEIDQVIYGAHWRESVAMDRLAWQTALLMNVAGSKPRDHDAWTPALLLGREPLLLDPDAPAEDEPVDPDAPTEEEPVDPEAAERILRAKSMLAQAQIKRAQAEGSTLVDVTPPEPG
jgi:hypothetical protein